MKKFVFSFLLALLPLFASADAVEINGICYNLDSDNKVAEVTNSPNFNSSELSIPASVTYEGVQYDVTSIRVAAFNSSSISTLTVLGNTVIGKNAFSVCGNLTTLKFYGVVSMRDFAFLNCPNLSEIFYYSENKPSINVDAFGYTSDPLKNITVYVRAEIVEELKNERPWTSFANILPIPGQTFKLTYIVDGEVYKTYDLEYGTAINPEPNPTKEGYTFSGWSDIPSTMPAKDVTVTGSFTVNTYKLTYMVDGVVYKTYDVAYGNAITPESAPTKDGYTFSGWSEIPQTMPAKDVTITGSFSQNAVAKYKLTYKVDGEVYKTYELEAGATITPEPAPTKEGYTFSGWSDIPSTMPAKDVTITGGFTINKYNLIYKVDGEVYKTYEVEYGASITPEPAPTKDGYTFSGWSDIPQTMPAKDVTITGSFSQNAVAKYKLTYKVDGEVYKTYELEAGATITPEPAPTKEGYTFSGWSDIPSVMPANDFTVTGSFTVNKYKLTYKVDGEVYKTYDVEFGATITPEPEPTKDGYTFSGWNNLPATMPANDVIATGSFIKNSVAVEINNICYNLDSDNKVAEVTTSPNFNSSELSIPASVTYEGVQYNVTSIRVAAFNSSSISTLTVLGNIVIGKNAFSVCENLTTLKFYGVVSMRDYAFLNCSNLSEIFFYSENKPSINVDAFGYTADPLHKITIYMRAEFIEELKNERPWSSFANILPIPGQTFKLTYMVDGEVYKTYDLAYGAAITPEVAPTKEGYTFSGWSDIPGTMPARDVIITGTFTKDEVQESVSYEIQGNVAVVTNIGDANGSVKIDATIVVNGKTYEVTAIVEEAFKGCTGITSVDIPNTVSTIGSGAFEGCTNLSQINIGKGIKEIGSRAFANIFNDATGTRGTDSSFDVYCDSEIIPWVAYDAFDGSPINKATLHVLDNLVESYKVVVPWNGFGSIVGLSATGIQDIRVFYEEQIFDIKGNHIDNLKKGLNIIRMKDGKTKKVIVK